MFFAKEVTKTEFELIEKRSLDAKEYGYEVFKTILQKKIKFEFSWLKMLCTLHHTFEISISFVLFLNSRSFSVQNIL